MLSMLKNWAGAVDINEDSYSNISEATNHFNPNKEQIHIVLHPVNKTSEKSNGTNSIQKDGSNIEWRITVKKYMTQKTEPGNSFDFMQKWNNNVPMPLRTMTGIIDKETKGMVHMKLHGDIWAEKITTCMCCGRKLTNPVSQYFGIGPECGGHNYVNPFNSDEELKEAVSAYKKQLQATTWEGWIIKSAITEKVEV